MSSCTFPVFSHCKITLAVLFYAPPHSPFTSPYHLPLSSTSTPHKTFITEHATPHVRSQTPPLTVTGALPVVALNKTPHLKRGELIDLVNMLWHVCRAEVWGRGKNWSLYRRCYNWTPPLEHAVKECSTETAEQSLLLQRCRIKGLSHTNYMKHNFSYFKCLLEIVLDSSVLKFLPSP